MVFFVYTAIWLCFAQLERENVMSQQGSVLEAPPLAELVIRVGDTRPVVITMGAGFHKTGEVQFSSGPFEDMMLAQWVLRFMANALADEMFVRERKVIADFAPESETSSVDTDDVPF